MALLLFLSQVFVISLSGVMAPGPVTAAAIGMGTRSRFAGSLIAVGHGVIEFPLILLIVLGAGKVLKLPAAQISIGLAGGAILLVMGVGMLRVLRSAEQSNSRLSGGTPVLTGILLTATQPYFLLWWATVGLALATQAADLGIWAFVLFAIVHWVCDFVWLSILSWASFKGSTVLGPRIMRIVLMICALALVVFGVCFVFRAVIKLTDHF
ncbi:MAG: LysE family transporter [Planctomycetota bacterium]|jgi:threonine/homoserine/homoserine lactone efflux protein